MTLKGFEIALVIRWWGLSDWEAERPMYWLLAQDARHKDWQIIQISPRPYLSVFTKAWEMKAASPNVKSWRVDVKAALGENWVSNGLRFHTPTEAEHYRVNLLRRLLVREAKVVATDDQPNTRFPLCSVSFFRLN